VTLFFLMAFGAHAGLLQQSELDALVAELVPLVEQTSGRQFDRIPEVVPATSDDLAEVLYAEQVHVLSHIDHLSGNDVERLARKAAGTASIMGVGKYGFLDKKLYVVGDAMHAALSDLGVLPDQRRGVLRVVVAHELAHALQDQHADLASMVSDRASGDSVIAVTCTIEGHAVWVHEQVGAALQDQEAVDLVAGILGYDPDRPAISTNPGQYDNSYFYGQGRNFVAHHTDVGGADHMWSIMRQPPRTSRMIVDPRSYDPNAEPPWKRRVIRRTGRARDALAEPTWAQVDRPLGDFFLRKQLFEAGGDEWLAARALGAWSSRALGDEDHGVEVRRVLFDTPDGAEEYIHTMARHAEAQLQALRGSPFASGTMATIPMRDGGGVRLDLSLDLPQAQKEVTSVWAMRGNTVVEILTVNAPPVEARLRRALEIGLR